MSWGIRYSAADFEVVPKDVFGAGMPSESIRLVLSGYAPAAVLVGSFVLYWFILLPVVFPATRPTTEAGKKTLGIVRDVHNLTICVYSGLASAGTAYYLYLNDQLDYESFMCTPNEGTWLRVLSVTFTLSKVWEWADTAFIVWLGNRPPGFLHTYHHATTFWLFCFVMNQPGSEKIGMLLNGFVHFLMYSHYYRSWPKPLVPLITILQILQLFTCLWVFSVNHLACPSAAFSADPRAWSSEFVSSYAAVPVFIFFFVRFFVDRWVCPKKASARKTE